MTTLVTGTIKLFTQVFTMNKRRSVFELLLEKNKICQKNRANMFGFSEL